VPVAYLKGFTDPAGLIYAYRKDDPEGPLHLKPDEIAFERYYYSQPLPHGGRDNNSIEDFFSTIETSWPAIAERLRRAEDANSDLYTIFQFIGMMRVRVPATRDMVETNLAETVKAHTKQLDRAGRLPPKPEGFEDILDHVDVSIDPHQSIHAMAPLAKRFGLVADRIGLRVIHNETGQAFLTSDNPVVYFDPDIPEGRLRPYLVNPYVGRIELLFAVDSHTMLVGLTEWKSDFSRHGLRHLRLRDKQQVKRINKLISRFGYRFVFSSDGTNERLIRKHAASSPVARVTVHTEGARDTILTECLFGPRPRKPKWKG
jgi:hypothetical protein